MTPYGYTYLKRTAFWRHFRKSNNITEEYRNHLKTLRCNTLSSFQHICHRPVKREICKCKWHNSMKMILSLLHTVISFISSYDLHLESRGFFRTERPQRAKIFAQTKSWPLRCYCLFFQMKKSQRALGCLPYFQKESSWYHHYFWNCNISNFIKGCAIGCIWHKG